MAAVLKVPSVSTDLLAAWIETRTPTTRRRGHITSGGLRFAFYWRVSTHDYQDPVSSRRWQFDFARELTSGHGRIVIEFADIGHSREVPLLERPQAAILMTALADPDRGFDAIVVGEYARAFYGSQIWQLASLCEQHTVKLWLPETDGPVDFNDPAHRALMMLLGAQSKQEVQRSRYRTTAAMQAQAREQGRYLGGRPPYGYRLVDAGPHPNQAHAEWGRRLHRLEPDPATAGHVIWMFTQRLAGHSLASIARALNELGVPCPSAADRERNLHRNGEAWCLRTVATILSNPRYTGRQVWNRKCSQREPRQDAPPGLTRQLNAAQEWAISDKPAHPALISEQDFVAAQTVSAMPEPKDGSKHVYLLTGLLRCRLCGRSLESQWSHGNPSYRCRHGHTSAHPRAARHASNLYLREDYVLAHLQAQLSRLRSSDSLIQADLASLQAEHNPTRLAAFLRANTITVVCEGWGLVLESEAPDVQVRKTVRRAPEPTPKVPRRRAVAARTTSAN